jgi:5-methylcytosine-specific restriction endonuclease McrA
MKQAVKAFVLERDQFTCQMCGAVAGETHLFDHRPTRLQIGHVIDKSQGGSDEPGNLRALCSVCNEGAANLTLDRPSLHKLLVQVRRATAQDQLELLNWLRTKFPKA